MKKLLKVFMYLIIGILSLLIILTVVAKLTQNKITDIALEYVSETIKAPVIIDDVSFNLMRKFPFATIEFNGVYLGSSSISDSIVYSEYKHDTLVFIDKIYLSVKSKALLDSKIEIVKIEIERANFNYSIDKLGASNYDFLMDTTQVEDVDTIQSEPLDLMLKNFSIKNITLNYTDSLTLTWAKIFIPGIKIKGKANNDIYSGAIIGEVEFFDCAYAGTNLHLMELTKAKFDLAYANDSLMVSNFNIVTDGADFTVNGTVVIKDTISTNINFKGTDIRIGELIKYAPKEMLNEFGLVDALGVVNVNGTVQGYLFDQDVPSVTLDVNMKDGSIITSEYPTLNNISFSGKISNGALRNNKSTSINFNSFHIEIQQSKFDFAFLVKNIDHPKYNVKTNMHINLSDFKEFIPDTLLKSIDGKIDASFSTKGQLPDSIGDDFADYVLERSTLSLGLNDININVDDTLLVQNFNAQFSYIPNRIKIKNLAVKVPSYDVNLRETALDVIITGKTTNMKTLGVDIRSYKIQNGSNFIEGNATIYNIDAPEYTMNTSLHLDLPELMPYVPDSMINNMTGIFDAEIHSFGKINMDSIDEQSMALAFENSRFNFKATDITLDMVDTLSNIDHLSMDFSMANDIINIDDMYGKYNGLEFWIDSTEILNVYETIIKEKRDTKLIVQTNVRLGDITNEFLAPYMIEDSTNTDKEGIKEVEQGSDNMIASGNVVADTIVEKDTLVNKESLNDETEITHLLPDFVELGIPHFLIRGKFSVDNLEYEKNILDDISLKFRFTDSLYVIEDMKFKMCGGDMNTSILFDARKWDKPKFDIRNYTTNFDIKQLLKDNNNFGDTALTYEKMSGILTSELHTRVFFIGDSVDERKIRMKGHFTLKDGHIYDYKPLVELSTGIGGLKELDRLDFNTMKTSVFMYKNKIYIPKTDVVSSALDMSFSAMYDNSNEDYEGHIIMHLGDVLTGKSDKLMKEQAKQNKKDGDHVERKGLNLVAMDINGKTKYGFDNDKLKKKFKNKINKSEGFLNLLFNPKLVNFSTEIDRSARDREILKKSQK